MLKNQTRTQELQILGCTAQHLGDRREQQDRIAIFTSRLASRCVLGMVADGVGGRSGGALAAENVMMAAQRLFDEFNPQTDSVEKFFRSLVQEAHTILGLSAYATKLDPHSTMVAVLIQPGRADWCQVGDSRLYFFRSGREFDRTGDHTLAAKLIAEGSMSIERAMLHPSASHLVQTLGGEMAPQPSLGSVERIQPGDRFLLCSDGLWSYFADGELAAMTQSRDVRASSSQLIANARERAVGSSGDNCSLVLLGIERKEDV